MKSFFAWLELACLISYVLSCQGNDSSWSGDALSGKCQEAVHVWCGPPSCQGNKSLTNFRQWTPCVDFTTTFVASQTKLRNWRQSCRCWVSAFTFVNNILKNHFVTSFHKLEKLNYHFPNFLRYMLFYFLSERWMRSILCVYYEARASSCLS